MHGGDFAFDVAFDDEVGVSAGAFGDAGVGEVDAFDPFFGLFDGFSASHVAVHEVGEDAGGGGVEVDFEIEEGGDAFEGTGVEEEVVAFDEEEVGGFMDAVEVGEDVVGVAGIAGPGDFGGALDEEFEVAAEGGDVDGVGLSFDPGEGDFGAVGEFAFVGFEVVIGVVEAVHGEGVGGGFFVEEAFGDEPLELFGEDGFAGAGGASDSDDEAFGVGVFPHFEEAGEEGAPEIGPLGGGDADVDGLIVDLEVNGFVDEPGIGIDEIE